MGGKYFSGFIGAAMFAAAVYIGWWARGEVGTAEKPAEQTAEERQQERAEAEAKRAFFGYSEKDAYGMS